MKKCSYCGEDCGTCTYCTTTDYTLRDISDEEHEEILEGIRRNAEATFGEAKYLCYAQLMPHKQDEQWDTLSYYVVAGGREDVFPSYDAAVKFAVQQKKELYVQFSIERRQRLKEPQ